MTQSYRGFEYQASQLHFCNGWLFYFFRKKCPPFKRPRLPITYIAQPGKRSCLPRRRGKARSTHRAAEMHTQAVNSYGTVCQVAAAFACITGLHAKRTRILSSFYFLGVNLLLSATLLLTIRFFEIRWYTLQHKSYCPCFFPTLRYIEERYAPMISAILSWPLSLG